MRWAEENRGRHKRKQHTEDKFSKSINFLSEAFNTMHYLGTWWEWLFSEVSFIIWVKLPVRSPAAFHISKLLIVAWPPNNSSNAGWRASWKSALQHESWDVSNTTKTPFFPKYVPFKSISLPSLAQNSTINVIMLG